MFTLLPLGLTAPCGTTMLGWLAVTQIRRTAGKLCGMWLAVFDGLLFPLLAMNGLLIAGAVVGLRSVLRLGAPVPFWLLLFCALIGLGALTILILMNVFIIRRVWRAVNQPQGDLPGNRSAFGLAC
jgi:hypothetical protein